VGNNKGQRNYPNKENALKIMKRLRAFLKGRTVIITTHDEKIIRFCDKKILIE